MAYAGAVIGAVGSVAAGILAAKNQKQPGVGASVSGGANQMQPQMNAFGPLNQQAPMPNPAFGQFLGGK